jgi:glycosyltransferase involved in cell wall biosynthesis
VRVRNLLGGSELREARKALRLLRTDSKRLVATSEKLAAVKREREHLRRRFKEVKKTLDSLPRYEFGSLSPGVESWSRRWREAEGNRVLLYAHRDYAGSFFKWAAAINTSTDYAVRLIVLENHPFGYPIDLLYSTASFEASYPHLLELIEQSDVVHIKDETGFYLGRNKLPPELFTELGVPLVFTHYGGYARKHADDPGYIAHVLRYDARVAMTPDLCFDWFDGSYIPHGIDVRRFPYSWRDGRVVGHSPSTPARKGTDELIEAFRDLDLTLDVIHGVSHDECLARKATCNLFFDQAGREQIEVLGIDDVIGWYANSALEAAVRGIPTIAHLSDDSFDKAARAGKDIRESCAIINTPRGPEGIRQTIAAYFDLSPSERRELSHRTRAWMEAFHGYEAVGPQLAALYDGLRRKRAEERSL